MLMLEVFRRQRPTVLVAIGTIHVLACIYPTSLQANGIVKGRANSVFEEGPMVFLKEGPMVFLREGPMVFFREGPGAIALQ